MTTSFKLKCPVAIVKALLMLKFELPPFLLTATLQNAGYDETTLQQQDTPRAAQLNLLTKRFTRISISRQLRIFIPVNCKQKLTGEPLV